MHFLVVLIDVIFVLQMYRLFIQIVLTTWKNNFNLYTIYFIICIFIYTLYIHVCVWCVCGVCGGVWCVWCVCGVCGVHVNTKSNIQLP